MDAAATAAKAALKEAKDGLAEAKPEFRKEFEAIGKDIVKA